MEPITRAYCPRDLFCLPLREAGVYYQYWKWPSTRLSLRYKLITIYALMLTGNGIQRLRAQVLAAQFWTQVPILQISGCMALYK